MPLVESLWNGRYIAQLCAVPRARCPLHWPRRSTPCRRAPRRSVTFSRVRPLSAFCDMIPVITLTVMDGCPYGFRVSSHPTPDFVPRQSLGMELCHAYPFTWLYFPAHLHSGAAQMRRDRGPVQSDLCGDLPHRRTAVVFLNDGLHLSSTQPTSMTRNLTITTHWHSERVRHLASRQGSQ